MDKNKVKCKEKRRKVILGILIFFMHVAFVLIFASFAINAYEVKGIIGVLVASGFSIGIYCFIAFLILYECDII